MAIHEGHRERKREQFIKNGLDAFSEHEALELLLFYAVPRRDTNPIAHDLINKFGTLDAVMKAPLSELQKIDGIGESAAALLHLIPQLYRKSQVEKDHKTVILNSISSAGEYFMNCFIGQRNEVMLEATLDQKGRVIACHKVSEGSVNSANVNIRHMVELALLDNASAVMVAHNHPSGIALPSSADNTMTVMLKEALDTVSIMLADHIVVADNDFVSMAANGTVLQRGL